LLAFEQSERCPNAVVLLNQVDRYLQEERLIPRYAKSDPGRERQSPKQSTELKPKTPQVRVADAER